MKEFNRKNLAKLHEDIDEAMTFIAKKHGIHYEHHNGSFSQDIFRTKVEFLSIPADGQAINKTEVDFTKNAISYGLKPEWLHKKISRNGELWEIIGLKTSSRKYPVLLKNNKGKTFKFSASDIAMYANNNMI